MRARSRDVTAGGLTRVAAVVAELAEAAGEAAAAGHDAVPLDDLIAKAAMAVEGNSLVAQALQRRAAAQRARGQQSIKAVTEAAHAPPPVPHKLDITR